jgi:hypothetical protein
LLRSRGKVIPVVEVHHLYDGPGSCPSLDARRSEVCSRQRATQWRGEHVLPWSTNRRKERMQMLLLAFAFKRTIRAFLVSSVPPMDHRLKINQNRPRSLACSFELNTSDVESNHRINTAFCESRNSASTAQPRTNVSSGEFFHTQTENVLDL